MQVFGDESDQVYCFVSNGLLGLDVEDRSYALVRSRNGLVAIPQSSATQWRDHFRLDIFLERPSCFRWGSFRDGELSREAADPAL